MSPRFYFSLFKETFQQWNAHKAPWLGAALAYYTVFSLTPLLVILIAIVAFVYGQQGAQVQLIGQLERVVGTESATLIASMLESAHRSNTSLVVTLVGVATLLLGALGIFGQLQAAINTIWDVKPAKGLGLRRLIRDRLVSLGMVFGSGILLVVSLVASTVLVAVGRSLDGILPVSATVLEWVNVLFWLLVSMVLFAAIFRFLPDAQVDWSDVWHGALITSLLFTLGRAGISFYLGMGSISSVYGTAGSLAVLLVWIYYSAQILLFGAEFTHVYAMRTQTPAGVEAERRAEDPKREEPFHERVG